MLMKLMRTKDFKILILFDNVYSPMNGELATQLGAACGDAYT